MKHTTETSNEHVIKPRLKSIKTVMGIPVSGANADDYPLYAVCLECDKVIMCRSYLGDWIHIG